MVVALGQAWLNHEGAKGTKQGIAVDAFFFVSFVPSWFSSALTYSFNSQAISINFMA